MRIGVVIVTYNRIKLLKECINRVLNQTFPVNTVIVVNNNSSDGTREYLDSFSDKRVKAFHQTENVGGAGGFNIALKIAQGYDFDYVLIIDDDAMVNNDYMEKIIKIAEQSDRYNAFAGAVYTEGEIDTHHRRVLASELIFAEMSVPETQYNKRRIIDFATFCGLVIRGKTLKEIGIPKAEYFLWYDDTEFCLRLKDKGKIVLVPDAILNHKTKPYIKTPNVLASTDWRHYYGYRNRYDCAVSHLSKKTQYMIILEYVVFMILSVFSMLNKKNRSHGKYNIKMLKDVIKDSLNNKLGINEDYLPK